MKKVKKAKKIRSYKDEQKKKTKTSEAKTEGLQPELWLLQLLHSDGKDTGRRF